MSAYLAGLMSAGFIWLAAISWQTPVVGQRCEDTDWICLTQWAAERHKK